MAGPGSDAAGLHEPGPRSGGLARWLSKRPLRPAARILDLLPRNGGLDTTAVLVRQAGATVDVVPASEADRDALIDAFGDRIGHAPTGLYDLVVVSPTLGEMAEMTLEAPWLAARWLKPGGRLLMLTLRPGADRSEAIDRPQEDTLATHQARFGAGPSPRLPADLRRDFVLEAALPRDTRGRSYVGWLVLRRRRLRFPVIADRAFRALAERVFDTAPLFAASDSRRLLDGLAYPKAMTALSALARRRPFDTVMAAHNAFTDDPRVMRTAAAVGGPGLVTVGVGPDVEGRLVEGEPPLLRLPDARARLKRRLMLDGRPLDRAVWWELRMAVGAAHLAWVLTQAKGPGRILHSHDFMTLYMAGVALEAVRREGWRWIHDAHEYVAGYGLIDEGVRETASAWEQRWLPQVDALTTVSPDLAKRLAEHYPTAPAATVILSAVGRDEPLATDAPNLRAALGLADEAPLLIHIGSIRPGRGVEHAIAALPHLSKDHLVLVGGVKAEHQIDLEALASRLGVADRTHFLGHVPSHQLSALAAQADVGLITMDRYGNADVALPNKLFLYLWAGLPIVATRSPAVERFLNERKIGVLAECGDPRDLARAIKSALKRAVDLRAAMRVETLLIETSWDVQATAIRAIHERLRADRASDVARSGVSGYTDGGARGPADS